MKLLNRQPKKEVIKAKTPGDLIASIRADIARISIEKAMGRLTNVELLGEKRKQLAQRLTIAAMKKETKS